MSLRIIGLQAIGIKALRAVRMEFDKNDNLITIGGENAAGKSSVLDLIESCLAKPVRDLARKGAAESKGTVRLEDEETGAKYDVTRVNKGGTMSLEVSMESPGGMGTTPMGRPSDFVKALQGTSSLSLDPLDFLNGQPVDQRNALAEVLGIKGQLEAIESECKELRAAHKLTEAKQKAAEDRFKGLPDYPDAPSTEVSSELYLLELQQVNARNGAKAELRSKRQLAFEKIGEAEGRAIQIEEQIKALHLQLEEVRGRQANAQKFLAENPEPEADESIAEIQAQINGVSEVNRQVLANREKARARAEWQAQEEIRANAFRAVREMEAEKKKLLAAQQMPVAGLEFSFAEDQEQAFGVKGQSAYEGLTLNGIPFSSASHAQQLEVAVSVALAGAGKVRVILVRDASTLDNRKLKALAEAAEKHGATVFAEIVSNRNDDGTYDRRTTFTIEDGELVAAERAA